MALQIAEERLLEAMKVLLRGFERSFPEAPEYAFDKLIEREGGAYVYEGLLYALMRVIFLLHIEDSGVIDAKSQWYKDNYSLLRLFRRLSKDKAKGRLAESSNGWCRISFLTQALFDGMRDRETGEEVIIPYRGWLLRNNVYPFLMNQLRDEDTLELLKCLLVTNGKYCAYGELRSEQLGYIYNELMGYHIRKEDEGFRIRLRKADLRKQTGFTYVPKELARKVARRTLEPLVQELGEEPTSEQLLNLHICDPAMGDGMFLVEVCRYLAKHLDEALMRKASEFGNLFDSKFGFDYAIRQVAEQCIYGVDKNKFAVELAKMALWLEVRDLSLPLTVFDDHLCHGDSMLFIPGHQGCERWIKKENVDMD